MSVSPAFVLQMSSDDAVKRVLAGEKVDMKTKASTSRSQDKENREGRERHVDREVRVCSSLPIMEFDTDYHQHASI